MTNSFAIPSPCQHSAPTCMVHDVVDMYVLELPWDMLTNLSYNGVSTKHPDYDIRFQWLGEVAPPDSSSIFEAPSNAVIAFSARASHRAFV
mmetsp:Transcript_9622/g.21279  ORF Transcript_9622/g.21279 Transcript_9622/m.21279 type:complete len:91 (-) Transcript_9622:145-417(-)